MAVATILRVTPRTRDAGFAAAVGGVAALAGVASTRSAILAGVVVVGALFVVLVAQRPINVAVAAVPACFYVARVGSAAATGGMSFADLMVGLAAILAVPALLTSRAASGALRWPLRGAAIYLATLAISVVVHPSGRAYQEWGHRVLLTAGSLAVGAWLASEGGIKPALRLYLAVASVFAFDAAVRGAQQGFTGTVSPLGFQKNFVAPMLAVALIVLLCLPDDLSLARVVRLPLVVLMALGVLGTGSRGGMLFSALGIAIFVVRLRGDAIGRRGVRVLSGLIVAGVLGVTAYSTISAQLDAGTTFATNSIGTRRQVTAATRTIWQAQPAFGAGLKYFNAPNQAKFVIPPVNAEDGELAEAGFVGLAGFAVFHVLLLRALWPVRTASGVAALAAVAGRLLHGQFDVYWGAGNSAIPFILAGMALELPRRERA